MGGPLAHPGRGRRDPDDSGLGEHLDEDALPLRRPPVAPRLDGNGIERDRRDGRRLALRRRGVGEAGHVAAPNRI